GIGAATLSANLENNNVTLATVDDGTEPGDMYVNGAVSWSADHTLSLNAHNDIHINEAITATNGGLTLNAGGAISADGAVNVGTFNLQSGAWSQLGATLADFSARDFQLNTTNASFLRANGGDGSDGNAYQIVDLYGLQGIASRNLLSSHFALSNDIDASGTANWNGGAGFLPIGDDTNHYTGSFDGQGHIINGLTINRPNTDNVGLFGVISASQISNIGLTNATITGQTVVGGLVGSGTNNSRISHSSVMGDLEGAFDVGALAGAFNGTIEHSHSGGSVVGYVERTGGLVGSMTGQISDSYSTATVAAGSRDVGGLVGVMNGTITASHAGGNVSGATYIGGLVGRNDSTGTINQSYATGSVSGAYATGGLVGMNFGTINQSYVTGRVSGFQYAGALIGTRESGTIITNSYWNTEASGQASPVGAGSSTGITGLTTAQMFDAANFSGFDFAGTWANADDQTTPYLRALVGNRVFNKNDLPTGTIDAINRPALYTVIQNVEQLQAMRDDVTANYLLGNHIDATATVSWNGGAGFDPIAPPYTGHFDGLGHIIDGLTINRPEKNDVGLFAVMTGGQIRNTHLHNASITGRENVGGLVGELFDQSQGGTRGRIIHSSVAGTITGNIAVGGLVGQSEGSIEQSYATADVSGEAGVGGLVGASYGDITQSYATGDVSGVEVSVGGLVGANFGVINQSYASGRVTGDSVGGFVGYQIGNGVTDSYWNVDSSGQANGVGFGSSTGATGLTTAQMLQADSFTGWDIDAQGGTGTVWRIYEGYTAPLLRHFLTALEVTGDTITTTYNGTNQSGTWSAAGEYDSDRIFGQVGGGRNSGTYALDMNGLYSDQQGYDLIITDGGTLTINKAQATVTANSGTTTYNGTEQSVSGFTVDGLVNGEDASVLSGVTTSGGKGTNAGSYTLTASGTDGNYELNFVDGALTINKAKATVTAHSGTTTYNGTEQSVDGFTVEGLVNGEDVSVLTGVTTSGGKGTNAGSYTLTASGTDGNYELSFVNGALTINKAKATVTANSGTTTYNGTEQSVDGFTVDGLVNGEDASVLSGVTTSGGKGTNAGSYTLTASGTDGNYELSFVDGTLTINKAQATVTANSGTTTYNGTEQSVDGFTVEGLVNGEDVSVLTGVTTSGGKGTNAGSYTLTASGTDGNYELSFVNGTLTIERKAITGNITADGKTYDGSTYANTHGTLDGVISGDDLQFNTSGAFADKHVGTGKQVTVSGSLGGGDAGNYVLTTNSSTTANIDRKTITADIRALDKLFDGSLAATLEGVLNGTISGDDVALQLSGLFASLTPGENRVLVDASLTGADAGNYQLVAPDSVTASLLGVVQNEDYQSANVSQPPESRRLSAPGDAGYQLDVDDDALHLPMASR
ncbi:beta strand repeat-containing protein, partial [Halopseudomonas oceani]